jgi:4-hydroxybenzoate polyprenyltransferase
VRHWLRFLRVPIAPTAAWDAAACTALALTGAGWGLGALSVLDWIGLIVTSLLIYGFGMGANDIADRHRDERLAPDRPLPSGLIPLSGAVALVLALAVGAVALGGGRAGSRIVVVLALLAAAAYDFGAKKDLVAGALAMGAVRFLNASLVALPLVYAGLASPLVLLAPAGIGVYSAGIVVLSTTEETPSAKRLWIARGLAALAFAVVAGTSVRVAGGVTLGSFVGTMAVLSLVFGRTPRPVAPKIQVLEMLLGLYFLSLCAASAAEGGAGNVALASLGVTALLIYLSRLLLRALRPKAA